MKTKIKLMVIVLALFTIRANAQLTITSINVTNASSCSACDGKAVASVSGGTAPYTYYWSNIFTNHTHRDSNLCPGTYYLVVEDALGDTTGNNGTFNVGPPPIVDTLNTTNATCSNNNGSASENVSGGSAPYTYLWMPGGQTTSNVSGLSAGTYTSTVADAGGCSITNIFTIISGGLILTVSETDALCNGGSTGTASVTNIVGGVSPYTYVWTPGGQTNATATGLSAGTYYVHVQDHNGCTGIDTVTVGEPFPITFDTSSYVTGASCSGNNGTAYAGVYGGTFPYTYSWSPSGQTNATATGLTAGSYTVTVKDANGCSATNVAVVPTVGPIPTIVTGNDSCNGQSNGFAFVNSVSGGVAPYTYSWAPSGNTHSSITGLSAGNYTVTVTDKNGCSSTTVATIYQPGPLSFTDTVTADTGGCIGGAWVFVNGGTAPYTFTWSAPVHTNYDSLGNESVDSLCAGAYLLCITDANGCTTCDSVHVPHHSILGVGDIKQTAGGIKVYPDPVSDRLNLAVDGIESGIYSMYVYDMIGRQVLQKNSITINPGETIQVNVSGLPSGKYMLRLSGASSNKMAPFIVTH